MNTQGNCPSFRQDVNVKFSAKTNLSFGRGVRDNIVCHVDSKNMSTVQKIIITLIKKLLDFLCCLHVI